MWWRPSIRVNSYTVLSVTCLFHCNSSISFVTSFLWFQHSPPLVTSFLSFQLLPSVCCQVVHFVTVHPSFRFTSFINPICYSLSFHSLYFFNSSLPFGRSFRFNSSLSFVVAFDALLSSLWPLALAATCSHLRPLAATPVAASGCFFEIQIPRELQPQWLNCLNPSCFLLEILIKS